MNALVWITTPWSRNKCWMKSKRGYNETDSFTSSIPLSEPSLPFLNKGRERAREKEREDRQQNTLQAAQQQHKVTQFPYHHWAGSEMGVLWDYGNACGQKTTERTLACLMGGTLDEVALTSLGLSLSICKMGMPPSIFGQLKELK